jgi:D-alanyl-D-alanine carboxypeptidase
VRTLRTSAALSALVCLGLALTAGPAAAKTTDAEVLKGLEGLVTSPGGPPGAIATLYRGGKLTTLSTGRADIGKQAAPRTTDHMRIASVAKAFSGAVALHLVAEGKLRLDDTIAKVLPTLPSAWGAVTLAQLLHPTSGDRLHPAEPERLHPRRPRPQVLQPRPAEAADGLVGRR